MLSIMHTKTFLLILAFCLFLMACLQVQEQEKTNHETDGYDVNQLTVNNFHPVSIYNTPKTEIVTAKYPVIDLHTHPYARSEAEITQWVKTMDEAGIAKSVIMSYETGSRFDSVYEAYAQYPDRFILFCGFDYTGYDQPGFGPSALAELERCFAIGARGVGELGDKGKGLFYSNPTAAYGMHIDDPRMDLLLKRCGELNMPVSIHVAEPIWMYMPMDSTNDGLMNAYKWRLDNQPGILQHQEMIKTLENAVKKHAGTTFIACHYANCSYDLQVLGDLFDRYGNLYADISARFGETAPIPRYVNRFFQRYQDRLLYGTDMGLTGDMYRITFRILETEDEHFYDREHFNYHWPLNGYGLPDEVLEKVYLLNGLKVLNLSGI